LSQVTIMFSGRGFWEPPMAAQHDSCY
jgi:hypothetical protein